VRQAVHGQQPPCGQLVSGERPGHRALLKSNRWGKLDSIMVHFLFKNLIWLIGAIALTSCTNGAERNPDRLTDEREIRSLVAENAAASNAGHPEGVAATYTSDGDAWISGQSRAATHQRIAAMEGEWIAMPGYQRWEGKVENIRFVSRDAAIVEVSAPTFLDTGNYDEETTLVVVRSAGSWKIAAWRVMNIDEGLVSILTSGSKDSDRRKIQNVLKGIVAAAQVGDLDAYLSFVTDDAVMMWGGQPEVIGHQAIHEYMSRFSGGTQFDVQWNTDDIEIFGNRAYHRYSGVAVMTPTNGGEPVRLDRKYLDLLRKEDGTWRISHHIFNLNVPYSPD
jgi:uncharacterized protein (TIGR02246 family)